MTYTCGCTVHIYKEKVDIWGGAQLLTMLNSRASPLHTTNGADLAVDLWRYADL